MKKYFYILIYLAIGKIVPGQAQSLNRIDKLIERGHLVKVKNADSALIVARDVLHQSHALNYPFGIIKAHILASYYFFDNHKYDTAKFLLNKSIRYFAEQPKHQNTIDHGRVFLCLAYIAVRELNLTLAKIYAQRALDIFKQQDDEEHILSALVLLGGIESNEGNYVKGLAYYANAMRIKATSNYPEERCVLEYSNMASLYIKIGQYEKAILYSKKAFDLSEKYRIIDNQLLNLNNLGAAYSALKKFDSAFFYYKKCVLISKTIVNNEKAEIALYNIANLFHKQGQYKESSKLVKEVLASKPALEIQENAYNLMAHNYFKTGKTDSSIILARKLYKTIHKYWGNTESRIEITNLLAKAYEVKKKYDSALYYLNINQTLVDSLYNQPNQQKNNLMYEELANLDKEKEIKSLEHDSLMQKKRNEQNAIIILSSSMLLIFISISIILAFRNKDKKEKLISIELKKQLEKKKRDLHQQTLKIIYMNNSLIEVETGIKKIQLQDDGTQSKNIELILQTIRNSKTLDTEWQNFSEYFDQVYDQFSKKVDNRFPSLSISEKRLILLIKMELKNREIASILNIDASSVKMAKYRLKKRLQLPEEIDVQQYLQNFN